MQWLLDYGTIQIEEKGDPNYESEPTEYSVYLHRSDARGFIGLFTGLPCDFAEFGSPVGGRDYVYEMHVQFTIMCPRPCDVNERAIAPGTWCLE